MEDIRTIVERAAAALGTSADPAEVETYAASLLSWQRQDDGLSPVVVGHSLYISIADCSSLLAHTVRARAYDKIRRIASHLPPAVQTSELERPLEIAVSPISDIAVRASGTDFVTLAQMLDAAASDCGVAVVSGFSAVIDHPLSGSAQALISVVPEVLNQTGRLVLEVKTASAMYGINLDGLLTTVDALRRLPTRNPAFLRFGISTRDGRSPHMSAADAALFTIVDAAPLIASALETAPDAPAEDLCDILAGASYQLARRLAERGDLAANVIRRRSGYDVGFQGLQLTWNPAWTPHARIAATGFGDRSSQAANPSAAPLNRSIQRAFNTAVVRGMRAGVRQVHRLPESRAIAFTASTSAAAAAAHLSDYLSDALARREPLLLHPDFVDNQAGDVVSASGFHEITVVDSAEHPLIRRGGRIPTA